MSKLVEAWMVPGMFKFVRLDKEIVALDDANISNNEQKLQTKLEKERTKNPSVCGIIDGGPIMITLYDNGKFSGRVWASGSNVSGKYDVT